MSTLRTRFCQSRIILYLVFFVLSARNTQSAPVYESQSTQAAEYDANSSGCYYNFQRYQEGARIITNEPCLNCTCHNRMLMCYLRVCPFTKAIGQDCIVEKRPDQCCPVITCPEVPVQLLTSKTTPILKLSPSSSSLSNYYLNSNSSSTELGFPDIYGCNVNDRFFADGAQLPIEAVNPCELCYCIRNKTTCVIQQCTLSVAGCRPVYQPGICCPIKYNCEYDDEHEIMTGTTSGPVIMTTLIPRTTPPQCHYDNKQYEDGELIYTIHPCQHCYCFHGEIVCAVQECGKPMELHGKNCTALPPLEGECCPITYQCDNGFKNLGMEILEDENKKNAAQQSLDQEKNKQESFPGADNTIPEQIIFNPFLATNKSLTIVTLENEVPKLEVQESTKSSINKETFKKESFTTFEYERDKFFKPTKQQIEFMVTELDKSNLILTLNPNNHSSIISTESLKKPLQTTDIFVTIPTIAEKIQKNNQQEFSNTQLSTKSKISQIDTEFTTPLIQEKGIEKSTDREIINVFEKEMEVLEKLSTKSSISDDEYTRSSQFDFLTTFKEVSEESTSIMNKAIEKSSETFGSISEITTTEQSEKITESMFYTSDVGSKKPFHGTNSIYFTVKHDKNTVKYIPQKFEDRINEQDVTSVNYGTLTTTSSDKNNKIQEISTQFISKKSTTNMYSNDGTQFEQTYEPTDSKFWSAINSDETKKTTENDDIKNIKTSTVINIENLPMNLSFYNEKFKRNNESAYVETSTTLDTDKIKISKNTNNLKNIVTSTMPSTEILIKNNSNDNKKPEIRNESIISNSSLTKKNVLVLNNSTDKIFEKSKIPESYIKIQSHKQFLFNENKEPIIIEKEGSTGIFIPERVPEHKQNNDDTINTEMTEDYNINTSNILHNVDGLKIDYPEYVPISYLPSNNVSMQINSQPMRPTYEALPGENFEIKNSASLSIFSNTPINKTTINYISEIFKNIKSEEKKKPHLHISTKQEPSVETSTKQLNFNILPEKKNAIKNISTITEQLLTDIDFTQNSSLQQTITKIPVSVNHSVLEKNDESTDPSKINTIYHENILTLKTTIPFTFEDDYIGISINKVKMTNDSNLQKEKYIPGSLTEKHKLDAETPEFAQNNRQNLERNPLIQSSKKSTDENSIDKPVNIANSGTEIVSEHQAINKLSENMELNLKQTKFNVNNPTVLQKKFEETYGNTKLTTEVNQISSAGKVAQFTANDKMTLKKNTNEDYKLSTKVPIMIDHQSLDKSMQSQLPTKITLVETKSNIQENVKDISKNADDHTKLIKENKLYNINPQFYYTDSITNSQETVTYSLEKELIFTTYDTQRFIEEIKSSENILNQNEFKYSTENNALSSEVSEMESKTSFSSEILPTSNIPGEGNCLVDGQSYSNNSAIPPANTCQLSCRCASSIIQCELITCPPSPTNLPNCIPVFTEMDSCCPIYTCDSSSSIKLEASNQMSNHLLNFEEKIQIETTQNPFLVEFNSKINIKQNNFTKNITDSIFKSESESSESKYIINNESNKLLVPPISHFQKETLSSSIFFETTSPIDDINNDSVQNQLNIPFKINEDQENTALVNIKFINTKFVDTTEKTNIKIPLKPQSQTKNNKVNESVLKKDDIFTFKLEDINSTVFTEKADNNISDEAHVSTQTNILTELEIADINLKKLLFSTEKIEEITENDKAVSILQTTIVPIEFLENETQDSDYSKFFNPLIEVTSSNISENITQKSEEKIVETEKLNDFESEQHSYKYKETNSVHDSEISNNINTESSVVTVLTIENTFKPEEIELEYLTTISPDKSSTLIFTTSETTQDNKKVNLLYNYPIQQAITEKIFQTSDVTISESFSTTYSDLVKDTTIIKTFDNEKQPITSTINNTEKDILSEILDNDLEMKNSNEQFVPFTTAFFRDQKLTSPSATETTHLSIEQTSPKSSFTIHSFDTRIKENEFFNLKIPNDQLNKPESENKIDTKEKIMFDNNVEKQKKESTVNYKETSEKFETPSQETITLSLINEENEINLKPTELLINPEDEKEFIETIKKVESVLHKSTTSIINNHSNINQLKYSTETSSKIFTNKTFDKNELESATKFKEEVIFLPEISTKIESINFETFETYTQYPNKELEYKSSSEIIPEDEEKSSFMEIAVLQTSSNNSTSSKKPTKTNYGISSLIPNEAVTAIDILTTESQTIVNDSHEENTNGTVLDDELINIETSEFTNSEDDQYHIKTQQTREPIFPVNHENYDQQAIEYFTTTLYSEINKSHIRPEFPDQQIPETDDENIFSPDTADIKSQFNTDDTDSEEYDDQAIYGPGTCRYGGKIYMSAQQIPRDDACDFCFCFRSDIICLQQSCPPPIPGCHEEPIGGFCCPRYECPVSMAMSFNLTTTTTTTTTLPPNFLTHAYKGGAFRGGCQVGNKAYRVGEDIKSKSGPCLFCICGGDGKMKCEPKPCSASPMLKEMIAHAVAKKRRR